MSAAGSEPPEMAAMTESALEESAEAAEGQPPDIAAPPDTASQVEQLQTAPPPAEGERLEQPAVSATEPEIARAGPAASASAAGDARADDSAIAYASPIAATATGPIAESELSAGDEEMSAASRREATVSGPSEEALVEQEANAPLAPPAAEPAAPAASEPPAGNATAGCAPSPDDEAKPAAEAGGGEAGGGGCGGGGGGGVQEQPPPAAPDVSQSDPAAAMGAVANLPPAQLQTALGGVTQAASSAVDKQKQELAANPPQLARPSGVPAQRDASAPIVPPSLPAPKDQAAIDRAGAGQPVPVPALAPLPPAPPSPTQALAGPKLPGEAPLTAADTAKVQAAVRNMPTSDPALAVSAGDPPTLDLAGDADPARADDQKANVDAATDAARAQGVQDVAQPVGESDIYPTVPNETLTANPEGEGGPGVLGTLAACAQGGAKGLAQAQAKGGGAGGAANAEDETASIVAKEQKGDEIKASVTKAAGEMTAKQQDHAAKVADEKAKSQKDIDAAIEENAGQQKGERDKARDTSLRARTEWNIEQETLASDARTDAATQTTDARTQIVDKQADANKQAAGHIDAGNKEASAARDDAEKKAQGEKNKAEKDSGGFLGAVASAVGSFFDGLKKAIGDIFAAARKLVNAAIEKAKKFAVEAIESARKAVVGLIKIAGDALIAIGDRVLAGFPALRDKFRKTIKEGVDAAVDAVNKLADDLKKGVQKLLDLLGKAINAYLGLLECAYMAAVDAVAGVVKGAIEFAKNAIKAFAAFAELIKDVAANPGQWLSNLGSAVVDGLKNCFWNAFKSAVKNWFNSKIEEVLGLPIMIFKLLFKGCLKMKDIGKMAWEGLKAAIPMVLVQLLIEKLVAMIVPAAGAILTIIEGLRAAWGTVSRIITAFALFFAFLKAVKTGTAAGPFAAALAAAGVVVIDFVANWLLMRLRKPAGAVAGRLKALAQKIAAGLKRVFGAVKKGAKIAAGAIKRGAIAVGRAVRRGVQAVGRGLKKVGQAIARTKVGAKVIRALRVAGRALKNSKAGRAVQAAVAKVKRGIDKAKKWWKDRKEATPEERLERARAALTPKIEALIQRGVSRIRLRVQLALWRVFYGLTRLTAQGSGHSVEVHAAANPEVIIGRGQTFDRDAVFRIVSEIGHARAERARALGREASSLTVPPGQDPTMLGVALGGRSPESLPGRGQTVPLGIGGGEVFGAQGRGVSNVIIRGLGTYPEITAKLAQQGLTGPALTSSVLGTLRTGKGPQDVRRLSALMFGTEIARSNVTAATTPLTLLGMQSGAVTTPGAFGATGAERTLGGGLYPPSQAGFVAAQRRSQARLGGGQFREGTKIQAASEENINRTVQLITAITQEMVFTDIEHMRRKITELLEAFDRRLAG
jgi:hypothetical protein